MMNLQAAAVLSCMLLHGALGQFVVETNSMRVREPAALSGEFDVAIGDVRPSLLSQHGWCGLLQARRDHTWHQ